VVPSSTPAYHVSYGDTKYDLQNQQDLKAPAPVVAAAPATHATAGDNTDGWQIATWVEGGVIVALFLGGTALFVARRRTPRLGV
jgi:hypothetical protein